VYLLGTKSAAQYNHAKHIHWNLVCEIQKTSSQAVQHRMFNRSIPSISTQRAVLNITWKWVHVDHKIFWRDWSSLL